ncbi:MAG: hypothetical protein JW754_03235 [Candidatus Aenigmarchaeota archaeon]|nr:hypothetical protein [Candidatus Aenigmarchaeota archaeon]
MKKPIIAILAIFSLSLLISMGFAFAAGNHSFGRLNYDPEVHEQMMNAIENGNYTEWARIREENRMPMRGMIFENINEDNFQLYTQLHQAVQNGDTEMASQLREQLGLDTGMFRGMRPLGHGGPGMNREKMPTPEDFCTRVCGCEPAEGE